MGSSYCHSSDWSAGVFMGGGGAGLWPCLPAGPLDTGIPRGSLRAGGVSELQQGLRRVYALLPRSDISLTRGGTALRGSNPVWCFELWWSGRWVGGGEYEPSEDLRMEGSSIPWKRDPRGGGRPTVGLAEAPSDGEGTALHGGGEGILSTPWCHRQEQLVTWA